jgi:hypothetical protein
VRLSNVVITPIDGGESFYLGDGVYMDTTTASVEPAPVTTTPLFPKEFRFSVDMTKEQAAKMEAIILGKAPSKAVLIERLRRRGMTLEQARNEAQRRRKATA